MNRHWTALLGRILYLLMLCGGPLVIGAETYQVGVARRDITPEYPIRLNGFGFRREESAGVSQRIWAKALAISRANEPPAVVITLDSLGIRLSMVDDVAKRLNEQFEIPREKVAVTFSHSHCTPKVQGACDNIFSSPIPPEHQEHITRYTKELTEQMYQVAVAAIKDRQPATLEWNVGQVRFAKNRRKPGGPVDHDLPILVAKNPAGQPRAIYVSYACHCVTLSFNQISGDWAGYAQDLIERKFPNAVALVSIGCGSDSNPESGVTGDKVDIAAQQGAEIADEVNRLLSMPGRTIQGDLSARLELIQLPFNSLPTPSQLEELVKKGGPAGYNAQTQLAKLNRGESLPTAIRYPIQSFTFGDSLQMVFLAGEVCVDYSLRLKRELDRSRLWLNAYSNDFCAYIPSERLVQEGGYGGGGEIPYFALPATLQSGLEQQIVDEVRRQTPPSYYAQSATQGIAPKSPAESQQCLQTHDRLQIELVAAEPLVADPVAIDFGPDGRLWVVEMTDYARGVNEDFTPGGRVRFLSDTNNDGRYDQTTEFLTGLRFPTDVKVWRDGVLVCDAPDILFAADTNGDGRADVREVLFTGFATHNPHARVNSLRYGLDNWLHGSGGIFGGKITTANGIAIDLTNRDFRIQPDSRKIEPVTGQTQQGRPRDDWDNWFGCDNSTLLTHYVVDEHYIRRNPNISVPAPEQYVPSYPNSERLFPRGDLVLFKLSGAPGRPTAACGAEIYRDELLGPDFAGNAFVCEPVNQLVHRLVLSRKGTTFSGRRAEEESDKEFLTSTDRWFRPVQVRTGPDGAVWIVDMYRYVIEHPQWIPPETLTGLNVFSGQGLGRIYRILPKGQKAREVPRFDRMNDEQIADAIDSPNGTQRDLAQQLLVWKKSANAANNLAKVVQLGRSPATRIQAASTLAGLGQLKAEQILPLLADKTPEVRRHAIRLSEPFCNDSADLLAAMARLATDPAAEVRMQLAYSLGECRSEQAASVLALLHIPSSQDPYLQHAIASSLRQDNFVAVLREVLARVEASQRNRKIEPLLTIAASMGDSSTVGAVVAQIVSEDDSKQLSWRWTTLARVLDLADARKLNVRDAVSDEVLERVKKDFRAARAALGRDTDLPVQLAAIQLLGRVAGPTTKSLLNDETAASGDVELLATLVETRFAPTVQSAAVRGLSKLAGARTPAILLDQWPDATPRLRADLLDALLSRDEWLPELFDAIEKGTLLPGDLDATARQRLTTHKNIALSERATKLLASSSRTSRAEVVAAWQPALALVGDKQRGREAYQKRCAPCHQLDGVGFKVGPDLAALTLKSPSSLLVAILDPNRDVDGRYVNYVASLADGRTVSGLLVNEVGNNITLREQGGKEHVLLRTELDELRATSKSVMPEELEKDLSQQELSDLIAYLLPSRVPPKSFAGNQPAVITPDPHGALQLPATKAEIYGSEIAFESTSPFKNIGYWHDAGDYAGWSIEVPSSARYDVYLDYSCAPESGGNSFRIDGGDSPIRSVVVPTGDWSSYRLLRVGAVELPPGKGYLTLRQDGDKKAPALLDLRGLYLVPSGTKLTSLAGPAAAGEVPADPAEIARRLLDDSVPAPERQKLIADHPSQSAAIVGAMVADLRNDSKEEYRRIPWIWRVAIACGKRNQLDELRAMLDVAIPRGSQPLHDWRAVVIGGGVINGVTQAGEWPKSRIEAAIKVDGVLVARWQKAVEQSAAMADDEKIAKGTRYDALRMVAMGPWDLRGPQLRKYLAKGVDDELQMGAISGIADVQTPQAAEALLSGIEHYSQGNRELALDGLMRTPERCVALLDAVKAGRVKRDQLGNKRIQQLREHPRAEVQSQAKKVLGE